GDGGAVVGDPVDQLVAEGAELVGGHTLLLVPKLCLGTQTQSSALRARRQAELRDPRSQAELGNEKMGSMWSARSASGLRHPLAERADYLSNGNSFRNSSGGGIRPYSHTSNASAYFTPLALSAPYHLASSSPYRLAVEANRWANPSRTSFLRA